MAFNRYEQFAPMEFNLPKVDLGILAGVLDAKQQRFDKGSSLADELNKKSIDSLESQRARANAIQKEWQDQQAAIVSEYDGDYSAAYRKLDDLRRNMEKQLNPGGEANALITQKKIFMDKYEAMSKDKEVNPEVLNSWTKYYTNPDSKGYIGEMKQDPVTGAWKTVTPEDIIQSINPDDIVLPAITKLQADGYEREFDRNTGQWIMTHKESGKVLREEDIYNTALRTLTTHSKYIPGLAQQFKFSGIDDVDYLATTQALAADYAKDFAYSDIASSNKREVNPYSLARYKNNLDKELLIQQQEPMSKIKLDYESNSIGAPLTMGDVAPSIIPETKDEAMKALLFTQLGQPHLYALDKVAQRAALKRDAIESQIKEGTFKGNSRVMDKVLKENPQVKKASELVSIYNKQIQNIGGAMEPVAHKFGQQAAKQLSDQFLKGTLGQYTTITTSADGPIPYNKFIEKYGKDIYEDNGNVKEKYSELAVMKDGSDGETPGFMLKMDDGTVVKFEAPPAYVTDKAPITQLTQAYKAKDGIGYAPYGIGKSFALAPYYDPKTKSWKEQKWEDGKLKLEVDYETNSRGDMQAVETLYKWVKTPERPEGEYKKATYKYNDEKGNVKEAPMRVNYLNDFIDEHSIKNNFGIITDHSSYRTVKTPYGNTIKQD